MDEMLYNAATEGNTESLLKLIQEEPLILDRVNSITTNHLETPLHIAAMLGHERFVEELLTRKPELAREVDSRRSTALHLASAKGHVEIVKALLRINPDACFKCDRDGRNPLHVAAMMGRVDVLKEMLKVKPDAARVEMKHGENILHLCVEYCQFEALKIILEKKEFKDLVNSKDRNGNTILHLAIADNQVETAEFLLSIPGMDLSAMNHSGMTAIGILIQKGKDLRDAKMEESLKRAGAIGNCQNSEKQTKNNNKDDWIEQKRNALMIVASLVAGMAFQVGVNPPEAVWQHSIDQTRNQTMITNSTQTLNNTITHQTMRNYAQMSNNMSNASNATIYVTTSAHPYLKTVEGFYITNTMSFIASLTIVLLLMSGLPLRSRFFVWIMLLISWIAISDVALSYACVVSLQTSRVEEETVRTMVYIIVIAWTGVLAILLLGHTIRLFLIVVEMLWKMIKGLFGSNSSAAPRNNSPV